MKEKDKKMDFLLLLWGTLGALILGNMFTGKENMRAGTKVMGSENIS